MIYIIENDKEKLMNISAGICDTCLIPKMIDTGNGVNEPLAPILYCNKTKQEIYPVPSEDRMIECQFYINNKGE